MRPDSAGSLRRAPLLAAPAARDTGLLESEPPEARTSYGTFATARESLAVLVKRALGACADSARSTRGRTRFLYRDKLVLEHADNGRPYWWIEARDTSVTVPSLVVRLITARADCPGADQLGAALARAGWVENPHYDADGPDGTDFAYFCHEALCLVEMQWNGGDDSDTTDVAAPGYSLVLTCVPRPPEDPALRHARR